MSKSRFPSKITLGALALAAFILSGCLGSGGSLTNLPTDEVAFVKLKIRLGRVDSRSDANPDVLLNKGSAIEIKKLLVTFRSNLGEVVHDTVTSTEYIGLNSPGLGDSVLVDVNLRALRWWNIDVETRDQHDSVVHKGSAGPFSSKGGQTVDLTMPLLNSRYLMYEARYALPPEIYSITPTDTVKQKIYFKQLVLEIDGQVVKDSTSFSPNITSAGTRFITADPAKLKGSAGKFFFKPYGTGSDTATHIQSYEYVRTGSHDFKLSAYGNLEGDSVGQTPRLLYQGNSTIDVAQGGLSEEETIVLDWMGPGSPHIPNDTNKVPGAPNWNGIALEVKMGPVKSGGVTVGIIADFPE